MSTEQTAQSPLTNLPEFLKKMVTLFNDSVAHAFILHGNTRDYVPGQKYMKLQAYLATIFRRRSDIIIVVDPDLGIDIPIPEQRDTLKLLLDVPGAPQSPLAQALRKNGTSDRSPVFLSIRDVSSFLSWLLTEKQMIEDRVSKEKRNVNITVLFDFSELMLPDTAQDKLDASVITRFIKWAQSPFVGTHHMLVITADTLSTLQMELRRPSARWEAIEIPLPDVDAREKFITTKLDDDKELSLGADLTPRIVAQLTGGLGFLQIEDVLLRGSGAGQLTPGIITDRKQGLIKQEFEDVLQVDDPRWDLTKVAGYDYLKDWLFQRVSTPWKSKNLRVHGILMSGPPGTGKTQLAEALAGSCGVPFVVFRLSKILGQYVGNSERNLERALKAVLSLAPCVLFLDELDQTLQRGEEGATSGVDNRVFARILEFMEDPRRKGLVLIVAATNRPDLMDPALGSRFDRTVPVLPPAEASDRVAIIESQAREHGINLTASEEVVKKTEGWTGRQIRDFIQIVAELVDDNLSPEQALLEALTLYVPRLHDVHRMSSLAIGTITDLRLIPPHLRSRVSEEANETEEGTFTPQDRKRKNLEI